MSVSKVSLISIMGTLDKLDDVINFCGDSQEFEPENVLSFYSDTKELKPIKVDNQYKEPLETMARLAKESGNSYKEIDHKEDIPDERFFGLVEEFQKKIEVVLDKRRTLTEELTKKEAFKEQVAHFVGLDMNFEEITSCKFIKIRLGRLPKDSKAKLKEHNNDNPYVVFFTATTDEKYEWGLYVVPIEHAKEVDMIFSSLYFERLKIYGIETTPEEKMVSLDKDIALLKEQIEECTSQINKCWEENSQTASTVFSELKRLYTYCNVKKYVASYKHSFMMTGWIPDDKKEYFEKGLDGIGSVEYGFDPPNEIKNHTPPTKLKNKRFFKPFEFFVEMYGMPAYNEIDPTFFVSLTYILMFGIMFGDFGNGLVLSIVGYLMWKIKKMVLGKILIPCGISSMVFGLVFGSCFGFEEAFNGLYGVVLHTTEKPIDVMYAQTTTTIIYSTVGMGFVLIFIALCINIFSCFRRGMIGRAVFGENGICGLVFYVSLVAGLLCSIAFNIQIMNIFYILGLIILPLIGILFEPIITGKIEGNPNAIDESFGGFLVQRFFELFEVVLSYATNTISFLRVGAYVLVHTGMLMVVFTLAEMSSGVVYIIVVALGNAFVIGLEGLLVGIQVLRLEFYEMFSRFYDGDGRAFKPITVPREVEALK